MKRKKEMFEIDPHPAIPPADQLKEWEDLWFDELEHADVLLIRAFQAGADQELEACIDWIAVYQGLEHPELLIELLRAARRPKPPSLKEQAIAALNEIEDRYAGPSNQEILIRRALEQLND